MFGGAVKLEFINAVLEFLAHEVTAFIAALGYWGIALGMAIESANIPLPSEIILPFGGYLVSTGQLDFFGLLWREHWVGLGDPLFLTISATGAAGLFYLNTGAILAFLSSILTRPRHGFYVMVRPPYFLPG